MCGVAGVVGSDIVAALGEAGVSRMLDAMRHRGPDGEGTWIGKGAILGHARLAINDLSMAGHQPMVSEDSTISISVNGEIYNYPELRAELEACGAIFSSESDSEVVLHAWRFWGINGFRRFNGMFAIAIYDELSRSVYLVRDRLGIKPLYYFSDSKGAFFASEIKAIRAVLSGQQDSIDYVGLLQYLTYQNCFGSRTLSSNVKLVQPGCYVTIHIDGELVEHRYCEVSLKPEGIEDFAAALGTFKRVFETSVQRHLMSDVPVASYLSAGFDSASVSNQARQLGPPPVCFTGTFGQDEGWYDESTCAASLAANFGAEHVKVEITAEDFERVFDKLVWHLDEPKMGMGAFSQYCVAEKVKGTHKVILTGHGGDELFAGYPVFKLVNLIDGFANSPLSIFGKLRNIRVSELPHLVYFFKNSLRSREFTHYLPVLNSPKKLLEGLKPEIVHELKSVRADEELLHLLGDCSSEEQKLYTCYLKAYLPGLLIVEDKISMAHSLESRTPMLDNEMVELSTGLKLDLKMADGVLKALVKEAGKAHLPEYLYTQPKRGFPTPLRFWFRGDLESMVCKRIIGEQSTLRLLFDEQWLKKQYLHFRNSRLGRFRIFDEINSHRIWQLLSLESWLRQKTSV